MIIGICGFIGSGKDTIADYLTTEHGFRRDSFAATLKDAISMIFGWDRDLLEGRTKYSREWREQRDEWWSERLGREITPRLMLQLWGTEVCRRGFHNDIWVASLENKVRQSKDDVVISDCRFPNEIQAIRNQGGIVIRVVRGPEPDWYKAALDYNAGLKRVGWAIGRDTLEKAGVHASEYSWVGTDFDYVLNNNGSVDDLYRQVSDLLRDLHDAMVSRAA